jgi:hypothetical protein
LSGPLYAAVVRLRQRPFFWPIIVILFAVVGYAVLKSKRAELVDFEVQRVAAIRFLAQEPLYRPQDGHFPFKYLPAFAALIVPFTWPSKQAAEAVWFALTVAMAWAFVRLALDALPERRTSFSALLWLTLLLNGKFLVKELALGQFNLPLALLLLGAVIAAQRGRGRVAAGLIAGGVFIKPYALMLLPWLVWTQGRRALLPFSIILAAGLALPAMSYGWEGNLDLHQEWFRTVTETTTPNLLIRENISFASMWAKWLHPGPPAALLALASAIAGICVGFALLRRRTRVVEPNYLEGAYFFVLIPLLSPQGWDYLLLVALPAYVCLVDRWGETRPVWRAVTLTGFVLTSFAIYDLMRPTLYIHLMASGAGSVGAILIAASLVQLRWRALA